MARLSCPASLFAQAPLAILLVGAAPARRSGLSVSSSCSSILLARVSLKWQWKRCCSHRSSIAACTLLCFLVRVGVSILIHFLGFELILKRCANRPFGRNGRDRSRMIHIHHQEMSHHLQSLVVSVPHDHRTSDSTIQARGGEITSSQRPGRRVAEAKR